MSSYFISPEGYQPKKKKINAIIRFITILFPVIFFFVAVWLIFVRFQQSDFSEIEELIEHNKWSEANITVRSLLNSDELARPKLLMYGSIIAWGRGRGGGATQILQDTFTNFPQYENMLINEDTSKIFLRESFLRRMEHFVYDTRLIKLVCQYMELFPRTFSKEPFRELFEKSFYNSVYLEIPEASCLQGFLLFLQNSYPAKIRRSSGNNVNLRNEDNSRSEILGNVSYKEILIIRKQGKKEQIGSSTSHWYYILTPVGLQGWIYGKYVEKRLKPKLR